MTDLRERIARIAQNKMADHLRIVADEEFRQVEAEFMEIEGAGPASYAIADAVLLIARPAIIEECARVADRIAANPPSNDARHIDWQAGVQDGAMESAASIRVLAKKP